MSGAPKVSKGNAPHVVVFMITVHLPDTVGARVHSGRQVGVEAIWGKSFRTLRIVASTLGPAPLPGSDRSTHRRSGRWCTPRLFLGPVTFLRTLVRGWRGRATVVAAGVAVGSRAKPTVVHPARLSPAGGTSL